jgi:hypothetical protein
MRPRDEARAAVYTLREATLATLAGVMISNTP